MHGLAVALEELAAYAAVPVDLDVDLDGRLPEPIEVAAYYVVCESIANIGKHAHAKTAGVARCAREGGSVIVEVVDDGVGGADTEARIRAARPRRPRRGTGRAPAHLDTAGRRHAVRAEIPCGS